MREDISLQEGNDTGEPLYAQINRDLKTKRTKSICGNDSELLLMTTTTSLTTTSVTTTSTPLSSKESNNYHNYDKFVNSLSRKAQNIKNSSKSTDNADIYKNLNNNNNQASNQNQWV